MISNKLHNYYFRPVNFDDPNDVALALRFRRETHVINLGEGAWEAEGGDKPYLESRRKMSNQNRETIQIFMVDDDIAGMIEMDTREIEGEIYGYCYFFYLAPEFRGKGYGHYLDKKACEYLKSRGNSKARLTAISTNKQSMRYYEKQGWHFAGSRDFHEDAIFMEKDL